MGLHVRMAAVAVAAATAAVAQTIEIDSIPALGSGGNAEGRVVWSDLNAGNAGLYAAIAMLDTQGYGQYVKPTWDDYLTAVDGAATLPSISRQTPMM